MFPVPPFHSSETLYNMDTIAERASKEEDDFDQGDASAIAGILPGAAYHVKPKNTSLVDLDSAFKYIQSVTKGDIETSSVNLVALRRKIDGRLLPVMFLCYCLQYLDKVDINYAAVMGLNRDLKLKGNQFSDIATYFFVACLLAEFAQGYFLQKLPAGKWLGGAVVAWGMITACTAATHNYTTLLVVRVLLGIFESAVAPCLMLIASQYYTRSEQALRFCIWYSGLGIAQILGGLISFGFLHVGHGGLAGWRIMFIVLGAVTALVGAVAGWILPDTPMSAKWMTDVEKVALLNHVGENRTGIENHRFKPSQVVELLLDVQMWLLATITVSGSVASGAITTYSSTLIRNFGYTPKMAALLNAPSGVVTLLTLLIVGYGMRKVPNGHRWAFLVTCSIVGIISGSLMSFATTKAARLAGIYLINAVTANLIITYQWTMANVAGRTKRVIASAVLAGSFFLGSIIGPQTFRAKDAPNYRPATVTLLATQGLAALLTVVLFGYYVLTNRMRARRLNKLVSGGLEINSVEDTWGNLTDKQNVEFRYVY